MKFLVEVAKFLESSKNNEQPPEETPTKPSSFAQFKHEEAPQSPQLRRKSSPRNSPTTSLRRRNKSAPRNSNYDHDEREIPTLRQ